MQTRTMIASSLLLYTLASPAWACGPGAEHKGPQNPQFSVREGKDQVILKFEGAVAQTLMDHFVDPEVKRFTSRFFEVKSGYGLVCVQHLGAPQPSCYERLTAEGLVKANFPYQDSLKKSADWIRLTVKGPSLEKIYQHYSDDYDVVEKADGSLVYIKQRPSLTCSKTEDLDGKNQFECSQLISAGAYPIGTGSDPLIGSGTHPVKVISIGEDSL